MTVNKRKKNTRQRGSWTHGYGEKKKHRGAGSRGGRGHAGTGKRGDQKKPNLNPSTYFGKKGFKRPQKVASTVHAINVGTIDSNIQMFVEKKIATKKGDAYVLDLDKSGYTKLLGSGKVSHAYEITVASASERAIAKINKLNGSVTTTASE